VTASGEADLTH